MTAARQLLLALALPLFGCGDRSAADTAADPDCAEGEVAGVALQVRGPDGTALRAPHPGVFARVWVDEAPVQACEPLPGAGRFACGVEQPGQMLIQIGVDGVIHAEAEVLVEADGCHVIGHAVELQLDG
jgi:hypothetical protein